MKKRTYESLDIFVCVLNAEDVVRTSQPIEPSDDTFSPNGDYPTEWW